MKCKYCNESFTKKGKVESKGNVQNVTSKLLNIK